MKQTLYQPVLIFIIAVGAALFMQSCAREPVREPYQKFEYRIPMRDGVSLYTAVYVPKDASPTRRYPFLMQRTCFGSEPYGADQVKASLGPSPTLMADIYIFVYQDVRGRWASEGVWTNLTPTVTDGLSRRATPGGRPLVDERSDTYDTIEWLLKNVPHHNGRVGLWGISYAGFYAIAGAVAAHPALKAVSPQAPIADLFFDDFHHNGAFTQAYLPSFPIFGTGSPGPTTQAWYRDQFVDTGGKSDFRWQYELGPLKNVEAYYKDNVFWRQIVAHPNYDAFWQQRSIVPYLKQIKPAILMVGGWFDAEDLYGPLTIFKTLEANHPNSANTLIMGPFGHGGWARETGHTLHGDLYFGDSLATVYQRTIEAPFFRHYLKGTGDTRLNLPKAYLYDTGRKVWKPFDQWPLTGARTQSFYLRRNGSLSQQGGPGYAEFVSDPAKPVPYVADTASPDGYDALFQYMSADQRFASRRPDVLTFQTEVLPEDLTLGGPLTARLTVSTTGTDADWVVKLIDVYPPDEPNHPYQPNPKVRMANYQQMVRSEVMRGRFRRSFAQPEPFKPGEVTNVTFQLSDVLHTFKKGHRIMVQVQSTWFPLIDRNPQTYVENIYRASANDFRPATHRVYENSVLEVQVIP